MDETSLMAAAAADGETADRELLSLMSLLLHRSHFWRLTRRDSEIAKSLNSDYLSQLFILGSSRRLDTGIVRMFLEEEGRAAVEDEAFRRRAMASAAGASETSSALSSDWSVLSEDDDDDDTAPSRSSAGDFNPSNESRRFGSAEDPRSRTTMAGPVSGSDLLWDRLRDLPPEARGLLVFKRGHTHEVQRGRLFLPKLDFLQSLLVQSVGSMVGTAVVGIGGLFGSALRGTSSRMDQWWRSSQEEASVTAGDGSGDGVGGEAAAGMPGGSDWGMSNEREAPRGALWGSEEEAILDSLLDRTQLAAALLRDTFLAWGIPPRLAAAGDVSIGELLRLDRRGRHVADGVCVLIPRGWRNADMIVCSVVGPA